MQDYLNQLMSLNGWQFWISFGIVLLICEVLGTDYLMLFLGLAACAVGRGEDGAIHGRGEGAAHGQHFPYGFGLTLTE